MFTGFISPHGIRFFSFQANSYASLGHYEGVKKTPVGERSLYVAAHAYWLTIARKLETRGLKAFSGLARSFNPLASSLFCDNFFLTTLCYYFWLDNNDDVTSVPRRILNFWFILKCLVFVFVAVASLMDRILRFCWSLNISTDATRHSLPQVIMSSNGLFSR